MFLHHKSVVIWDFYMSFHCLGDLSGVSENKHRRFYATHPCFCTFAKLLSDGSGIFTAQKCELSFSRTFYWFLWKQGFELSFSGWCERHLWKNLEKLGRSIFLLYCSDAKCWICDFYGVVSVHRCELELDNDFACFASKKINQNEEDLGLGSMFLHHSDTMKHWIHGF